MTEGRVLFLFTDDLRHSYRKTVEAKDVDYFMFDMEVKEKIMTSELVVFIGLGQSEKILKSKYGRRT